MKNLLHLSLIFGLSTVFSSCKYRNFVAEDDVYSTGSNYVYSADKSDASYSSYVYTQENSSGTKTAYYDTNDSLSQNNQVINNGQGTTIVNNYYGGNNYNTGWYGYDAYIYRPRYRRHSVWYGWQPHPFHYGGYWGPSYGWGYGGMYGYHPYAWGPSYGWGYGGMYGGYGYNPYAWGHGYGYNPYGWGNNYYNNGWGNGGNTIIYGNVYTNGGGIGSGMITSQNNGGNFIKTNDKFIGKRPNMTGNSAPYTGPNKTKKAVNTSTGAPVPVEKMQTSKSTNETSIAKNNDRVTPQISRNTNTERLVSDSKPWEPRTTSPARNESTRPTTQTERIINSVRPEARRNENATNRPTIPAENRPASNPPRATPERTQPNTNQWNRNTPANNERSTPNNNRQTPAARPNSTNQTSPSRGGSYSSPSSSPSRGGSYSSPSSSPSRGGSVSSPSRGTSSPSRSTSGSGSSRRP